MTTISTTGYADIVPVLITGYSARRRARTVVHGSIDPARNTPYVSFAVAELRTGTLSILFDNQDDAFACLDRHALRLIFDLWQPQVHTVAMRYVVPEGDLGIEIDELRKSWIVTVPFHEVP